MAITRKVLYGNNLGCSIATSLTASGQAVTGSGTFHGFIIKCDGTNDVTINIYDNTSAAGAKLIPADLIFEGTIKLNAISFSPGAFFDNGIYVEITCVGTTEVKVLYNAD